MYPFMDEEVAWQRLQDLQREMEYSRFVAREGAPALWRLARGIGGRVRSLVAAAWPARLARPADQPEECDSASDAA